MAFEESTCWSLIEDAAHGSSAAQNHFATMYEPVVRAYLEARWRGQSRLQNVDDAVQEVFVDLLKANGALSRVDPVRNGGFRGFLFGITRMVALRFEQRGGREAGRSTPSLADLDALPADDDSVGRILDRAWARMVVADALDRQEDRARRLGREALQRVELLRQRCFEGLPIREIAVQWSVPADRLHHDYATARREFHSSLRDAYAFHAATVEPLTDDDLSALLNLLE